MDIIDFPVVRTSGYMTTFNICNDALFKHNMNLIYAPTGYGKSLYLNSYYLENPDNVIVIDVQASHTPKLFYSDLFNELANEKYNSSLNLNIALKRVANLFLSKDKNMLLVIDEATKFNHNFYLHLHDFRNLTKRNTGIVLAGGEYFLKKFKKWNNNTETGMPEFFSRINVKQTLPPPIKKEIISIIRANDIFDNGFERMCFNVENFRELKKRIDEYPELKAKEIARNLKNISS